MTKYQGKAGCPTLYPQKLQKRAFFLTQPQIAYIDTLVKEKEYKSPSQFIRRLLEAVI